MASGALMQAVDETPVKVRDMVRASHLAVGILSAFLSLAGILLPLAIWKGGVDEKLTVQQKLLDRLEDKMDRLTDAVQRRQP